MARTRTLNAAPGVFAVALLLASAASAQNQLIFTDGFESGDLSAWSKVGKRNGLEVNGAAAHTGGFGLEVLSGQGRTRVEDKNPRNEDDILIDFFFNPNNIELKANKAVDILQLFGKGQKGAHVRLLLKQPAPDRFELRLVAREKTGSFRFVGSAETRPGEWTQVSVLWVRAGSNGLGEGFVALTTDGILRGEKTNLINDDFRVDSVRLGFPKAAGAATNGSYYLDDFASFRTLAP